jgi:hypothetical protein
VSRVYVLGKAESDSGLNSGQLFRNGEQIGDLTARDVGRIVAQLSRWNVGGVPVEARHLLWCIPQTVNNARTLKEKIEALHVDRDYQAIASAMWDPPKPYVDTVQHIASLLAVIIRNNSDIDSKFVAAVWASWLDKVRLRPEVSLGLEEHLSMVLLRGTLALKETDFGAEKFWKAYFDLVERHYGARMDRTVEKNAIRTVARMIATLADGDEEFRKRTDDVIADLRKGLTPGTASDQCLMDGYRDARAAQFAKDLRGNRESL